MRACVRARAHTRARSRMFGHMTPYAEGSVFVSTYTNMYAQHSTYSSVQYVRAGAHRWCIISFLFALPYSGYIYFVVLRAHAYVHVHLYACSRTQRKDTRITYTSTYTHARTHSQILCTMSSKWESASQYFFSVPIELMMTVFSLAYAGACTHTLHLYYART